jgi:hypothetical protein
MQHPAGTDAILCISMAFAARERYCTGKSNRFGTVAFSEQKVGMVEGETMNRPVARLASQLALGAGALLLAVGVPSSVFAVSLINSENAFSDRSGFASFTPASVDPGMAQMIAQRSGGKAPLMRFTPANAGVDSASRSVTVAVRIDQQVAQSISGRSAIESAREAETESVGLRIAPTRYNLGIARGYSSFAQAPALSRSLSDAKIPDLSQFQPSRSSRAREEQSRFAARIDMEETRSAAQESEAVDRPGDHLFDVGGSFRLTDNLDVTAGVRYQQERDLRPLPEVQQQDSQAVYIGTQFRF